MFDATVITKLNSERSVLLGKQTLMSLHMVHQQKLLRMDQNPWDTTRIPGGSSGGSAAAVAAGLVPFALATETGGSIRLPASLCGICGWKPTYGRVSRYGVIAMTSSNDSPGAIARSVKDLAYTAEILSGHDPKDSTTSVKDIPNYAANLRSDLRGVKIGVPKEYFVSGMQPEVEARIHEAIQKLKSLVLRFLKCLYL